MQIMISGIPVEVCKKDIKNMHLYVKPPNGKVSVSAPLNMSDEAIERFVRSKSSWIKKHVNKFEGQPHKSQREYVSGETLYVWGKQYFLQVQYGTGKNMLVLSGDKAILTVRKGSTAKQRDNFVKEWYRELLKREVARLLPKWEELTRLNCDSWQTKYMKTRWGTCNTVTRKIWLNLQLAQKNPECLEYVILHELLHLIEKNHNARFLSLMDTYMPYWRQIKRQLNGQDY
ncbi:MAG: M48 family metallopeptidase [Syntrophomonadaceae bacterium]|jgi:predicted metal-dependent hydrolase|nr:M48 family metallopeptidase [Syntrophomonadaceae bacterium]